MTNEEINAALASVPPAEDKLTKWRREADEQTARFEQARRERQDQDLEARILVQVWAQISAAEERIAGELRSELLDVIKTVNLAFDKLESNLERDYANEMNAKLTKLDSLINKLVDVDRSTVTELPTLPLRGGDKSLN